MAAGPVQTFLQSTSRSTQLIIACAAVSLVCGLIGWTMVGNGPQVLNAGDIVYRSIAALMLSVPYQSSTDWAGNVFIEIARWSGMLALVTGASKTAIYLFESHWASKMAQRRKNHWMVIGDDPFAARLCDAALQQGHDVNWLACNETQADQHKDNKRLYADKRTWNPAHAVELGLHRAEGVVVSTYNDATTHAIAREVRANIPEQQPTVVMASIQSPWLGMRIDEIEPGSRVSIFSEAQMATRRLHQRHPPFLLAEKQNQNRMHIVIVEFTGYGEAVLIETLLSSLTFTLEKPLFTIIDQHANSIRSTLQLRYPELCKSAQLNFIAGSLAGKDKIVDRDALTDMTKIAPVTAIYCCDNNDGKALSSALAIQAVMSKFPANESPVFTRQTRSDSLPQPSPGVQTLTPGQLISFGALDELANDTGLFSSLVESLARTFHQRYQSVATANKPAKVSWDALSEDMRDANRRLVIHIPAKLHCLGLDLDQWLQDIGNELNFTRLPKFTIKGDRDELIERLATLEHKRWMAERRINGWTYNETRDNDRRLHPDLVEYEQLSEKSKSYDREMVTTLIEMCS